LTHYEDAIRLNNDDKNSQFIMDRYRSVQINLPLVVCNALYPWQIESKWLSGWQIRITNYQQKRSAGRKMM